MLLARVNDTQGKIEMEKFVRNYSITFSESTSIYVVVRFEGIKVYFP